MAHVVQCSYHIPTVAHCYMISLKLCIHAVSSQSVCGYLVVNKAIDTNCAVG